MKTITLLTFCLLCLLCSAYYSQEWQWASPFGHRYTDNAYNISSDNSGNVYVSGEKKYFNTGHSNNYLYNFICKFDKHGKMLWVDTVNAAQCRQSTTEQGITYLAAGDKLVKFSANGIKEWVRKDTVFSVSSIAAYPNGGAVILAFDTERKNQLIRYDENGNVLWKINHPEFPNAPWISDHLACDDDGFIYLSCGIERTEPIVHKRSRLLKLDSQGNIINHIPINPHQKFVLDKNSKDFYFLVYGGKFEANGVIYDHTQDIWYPPTYLIKYDSSAKFQWIKWIKNNTNVNPNGLAVNNNDVILAGVCDRPVVLDDKEFDFGTGINAYAIRIDPATGKTIASLSSRNGKGKGGTQANAVCAVPDGDVIVAGSFVKESTFGDYNCKGESTIYPNAFVAKISFKGAATGISEEKTDFAQRGINVFPNPFSNFVTLESTTVSTGKVVINVVNLLGATVYSGTFSTTNSYIKRTLDLSYLTKGAYFVIINSTGGTETKKIILH